MLQFHSLFRYYRLLLAGFRCEYSNPANSWRRRHYLVVCVLLRDTASWKDNFACGKDGTPEESGSAAFLITLCILQALVTALMPRVWLSLSCAPPAFSVSSEAGVEVNRWRAMDWPRQRQIEMWCVSAEVMDGGTGRMSAFRRSGLPLIHNRELQKGPCWWNCVRHN